MPGGPGKIGIDAEVYLVSQEEKLKVKEAHVYVHVKGYMRARVTHLDVENRVLGKIIHRGRGNMLEITGVQGGIAIRPKQLTEIDLGGSKISVHSLELLHPILNKVLKRGESTVTWVGRKYDGIYVGFKKLQIEKLEHIAKMTYGVTPMKHLEKPEFEPL
jgi:hypothetical protein